MKSRICVSNICVTNRKQTASFSIVSLMVAIAPLWLMLAAANTSPGSDHIVSRGLDAVSPRQHAAL